jgi:hypothetical protein
MRVLVRRLRGELRCLVHPATVVAVLGVALGSCLAQASTSGADLRPPSPIDVPGSLRIATQHHASTLGFVLVGAMAAVTTGTEVRIGAVGLRRLADHRIGHLWLRRVGAMLLAATASIVLTTCAVWATRSVTACREGCPMGSASSWAAAGTDLVASVVVLAFAASLATAIAVRLGSELATLVVTVAIYAIPVNRIGSSYAWALPTKWVAQAMQFEPYGLGSDYTGGAAATAQRGPEAAVAVGLLLLAAGACAWSAVRGLTRRSAMGPLTS